MNNQRDLAKDKIRRGYDPLEAGLSSGMSRNEAFASWRDLKSEVEAENSERTRRLLGLDKDEGTAKPTSSEGLGILVVLALLAIFAEFFFSLSMVAILIFFVFAALDRGDALGHSIVMAAMAPVVGATIYGLSHLGASIPGLGFIMNRSFFSSGAAHIDFLILGMMLTAPLLFARGLMLSLTRWLTWIPLAVLETISRLAGQQRTILKFLVPITAIAMSAIWVLPWLGTPDISWAHYVVMGVVPFLFCWSALNVHHVLDHHEEVMWLVEHYKTRDRLHLS